MSEQSQPPSIEPLKVEFKIDLSTIEGIKHAQYMEAWLAVQRYDCPDQEVGGQFHGFMEELRDALYAERAWRFGES